MFLESRNTCPPTQPASYASSAAVAAAVAAAAAAGLQTVEATGVYRHLLLEGSSRLCLDLLFVC